VATPSPGNLYHVWNVFQSDWNYLVAAGENRELVNPDLYTYMQSCFAIQRGGMRVKLIQTSSQEQKPMVSLLAYNGAAVLPQASQVWSSSLALYATNVWGNNRPNSLFSANVNGGIEVEVPFYSRFATAAVCDLVGTSTALPEGFDYAPMGPVPRNRVLSAFSAVPDSNMWVLRAISEDFSFGMFVSTPPLTRYSTSFVV